MSETPNAAEAQRIVDDLEDDIVDVDKAAGDQELNSRPDEQYDGRDDDESQADWQQEGHVDDLSDDVPGAPEPTD